MSDTDNISQIRDLVDKATEINNKKKILEKKLKKMKKALLKFQKNNEIETVIGNNGYSEHVKYQRSYLKKDKVKELCKKHNEDIKELMYDKNVEYVKLSNKKIKAKFSNP